MCKPADYLNNCGNCANAAEPESSKDCGDCLQAEMKTKVPYTKWKPRP